jgi:hypothetical protein
MTKILDTTKLSFSTTKEKKTKICQTSALEKSQGKSPSPIKHNFAKKHKNDIPKQCKETPTKKTDFSLPWVEKGFLIANQLGTPCLPFAAIPRTAWITLSFHLRQEVKRETRGRSCQHLTFVLRTVLTAGKTSTVKDFKNSNSQQERKNPSF